MQNCGYKSVRETSSVVLFCCFIVNMNNENTYEYRTTRPRFPTKPPTPDYDINTNPNIYPSQRQTYLDNPGNGVYLQSNNKLNYSAAQAPQVPHSQQDTRTKAIVDPLHRLSTSFNNFATSTTPVQAFNINNVKDDTISLEKTTLNDQRIATYAYPSVYSEPPTGAPFLQPPQSNLIQDPRPYYISVDSFSRDRTAYPSPSQYVFPLVTSDQPGAQPGAQRYRYKNIYEFCLESCSIPNVPAVLSMPYLLLLIEEFDGHYDGVATQSRKAFAKLYLKPQGTFMRLDKENCEPLVKVFYPAPLASLSRLTISILNPDGTLFNFGTDTVPPQAPNPDLQNYFTFSFVTRVVDVEDTIGHRDP